MITFILLINKYYIVEYPVNIRSVLYIKNILLTYEKTLYSYLIKKLPSDNSILKCK